MSGTPPVVQAVPGPNGAPLSMGGATGGLPAGGPAGAPQMGQMGQAGQPQGLPHDIRGILAYETPWYEYASWALLGAAILAALYLLYKWWEKRQANKVIPEPVIDHWAEVKKKIKKVFPQDPFEKPQQIEFFFQMSILLRECIELRTNVRATDLTFQELKGPLDRKLPLKEAEKQEILRFLERADMIKFAEKKTTTEEALECKKQVGLWAGMLTPRAEPGGINAVR